MQLSWGELLPKQRITDDAAGYRLLLELLAGHGDTPPDPISVAIETRFADARALKAYAGSAPVTRASGKRTYVGRRFAKNDRLMAADSSGPSRPCKAPREPTSTTAVDVPQETGTRPPNGICYTASWASSTTASRPEAL